MNDVYCVSLLRCLVRDVVYIQQIVAFATSCLRYSNWQCMHLPISLCVWRARADRSVDVDVDVDVDPNGGVVRRSVGKWRGREIEGGGWSFS
jgi:hypothetical protein